jgi:hypothetical protein
MIVSIAAFYPRVARECGITVDDLYDLRHKNILLHCVNRKTGRLLEEKEGVS